MVPVAATAIWPADSASAASVAAVGVSVFGTSACVAVAVAVALVAAAVAAWAGASVCSAGSPMRDLPVGAIRASTASGLSFIFAYARPAMEFATKYMANPNTVRRISTTPNWRQKTSSALLT